DQLPAPVRRSLAGARSLFVARLAGGSGPGIAFGSASGFYAPLRARGAIVGALALEFRDERILAGFDVDLLERLAEQAALAVDNARWFSRLRTVGAEQE